MMRYIISIAVIILYSGFTNKPVKSYLVQKIQLKDERLISILKDYIKENHLHDVEGVVQLKYKRDSIDNFYVGYMVYNELSADPPSHYTLVGNKFVLIYSGLEQYLIFDKDSFRTISKDCKGCFAEGPIIVEPTFWHVMMLGGNVEKRTIKKMPF